MITMLSLARQAGTAEHIVRSYENFVAFAVASSFIVQDITASNQRSELFLSPDFFIPTETSARRQQPEVYKLTSGLSFCRTLPITCAWKRGWAFKFLSELVYIVSKILVWVGQDHVRLFCSILSTTSFRHTRCRCRYSIHTIQYTHHSLPLPWTGGLRCTSHLKFEPAETILLLIILIVWKGHQFNSISAMYCEKKITTVHFLSKLNAWHSSSSQSGYQFVSAYVLHWNLKVI